jgi:putative redox protein
MKTRIEWVDNAMFIGETESSHSIVMDGPEASGGRNMGPRPMEMMLTGLGGCTSFDVVNILKKSRQQVSGCVAEISKYCSASIMLVRGGVKITHDYEILEDRD